MQSSNNLKNLRLFLITLLAAFLLIGGIRVQNATAYDGIVYVLSGGPIDTGDNPNSPYEKFLDTVKKSHPQMNLFLKKLHNSRQSEACQDIKDLKTKFPNAPIVLSGHSYGADASIWVSKCLEASQFKIDLLITVDTVARNVFTMEESLTVPDNVLLNFHYYQQTDPMIQSAGANKRRDGSKASVYNYNQKIGSIPIQSHLNAYQFLLDYKVYDTLAGLGLVQAPEDKVLELIRPLNEKYFKDYPLVNP